MDQKEVIKVILHERKHQQLGAKVDTTHIKDIDDFTMGDALSAMQYNLDKCREFWYNGKAPNYPKAMHYIRKIAALCIQEGESRGMPMRPTEEINPSMISAMNEEWRRLNDG